MNISEINKLLDETMSKIAEASNRRDLSAVRMLTAQASEIEAIRSGFAELTRRFESLKPESNNTRERPAGAIALKLRTLAIHVTEGMIRQNLLTLTPYTKSGTVMKGESFSVQAEPSGDLFVTELLENGNKFQERSKIAKFYRDAAVKPNDFVELQETENRRWILRKAPLGKYKSEIDRILERYGS